MLAHVSPVSLRALISDHFSGVKSDGFTFCAMVSNGFNPHSAPLRGQPLTHSLPLQPFATIRTFLHFAIALFHAAPYFVSMQSNITTPTTPMKNLIAIQIHSPTTVARHIGEGLEMYDPIECQWWVGTPTELHPARFRPSTHRVISAPVRFCGSGGWIHHPKRPTAPPVRERAAWSELSEVSGYFVQVYRLGNPEWAKMAYKQFRYLWMRRPLPLP
jgi:hypothetical protein